jgi:hypothetical protein
VLQPRTAVGPVEADRASPGATAHPQRPFYAAGSEALSGSGSRTCAGGLLPGKLFMTHGRVAEHGHGSRIHVRLDLQ